MGYLYVLLMNNGKYYVGSTTDINRRMISHQIGSTRTTKNTNPQLIFSKQFESLQRARHHEKFVKQMKSRKVIEQIMAGNREWKD